jgi:ribosome-binding ATPase YchF (GTP1/OBG family)
MDNLKSEKFVNLNNFSEKEQEVVRRYNLLTSKQILYVANVDENDISNPDNNPHYLKLKEYINGQSLIIPLSVSLEFEMSKLNDEEKQIFMADLNINEPGLNKFIKKTYELLNIKTFFTFGKDETKA